jgi:hypothetical protein
MAVHLGPEGLIGSGALTAFSWEGTANAALVPRTYGVGHNGTTTNYKSIHVGNYFGMGPQGGYFFFAGHGWNSDRCHVMVEWNNGGGADGIVSVRVHNIVAPSGITLSASHDSDRTITLTMQNTHSNTHGWQWHVWGPR